MKIVNTPIAEIGFDETENILYIKLFEGANMNMGNTLKHYEMINSLVGNKEYFAIIDASNYYTIERDAWEYAASKKVISLRKAVAHYNCSPANRLTISIFKNSHKTATPFEIFDTKEEAINWVKSLHS